MYWHYIGWCMGKCPLYRGVLYLRFHCVDLLVVCLTGLDLPEKHGFANVVSKLPFTSRDLDPTSLLERKQGLEKYIQVSYRNNIHSQSINTVHHSLYSGTAHYWARRKCPD